MGYNLLAVIDNYQTALWEQLEKNIYTKPCTLVADFMLEKSACKEPEFYDFLPVYDEIVDEEGKYIITYLDCGFCEACYLYEIVN